MANRNHNGGRETNPDDNRGSWRPQDQAPLAPSHRYREDQAPPAPSHRYREDDDRAWRDRNSHGHDDREAGWRATERHGQGQSGYSAGRHGDDRSQRVQNRNDMAPSAGIFEDRHHELGVDDRSTGRGRGAYADRGGYDPEHHSVRAGHDSSRGHDTRGADARGYDARGYDARGYDARGYDARSEARGYEARGYEARGYEARGAYGGRDERTGYHGGATASGSYPQYGGSPYGGSQYGQGSRLQGTQDERAGHVHRGVGPYRGRGPAGYHRSDERIREAVCESLTDDDQIDASQIEVLVRNGEVMLSGVVDDRRTKRNAEDCAYSVSGVRDVQNLLRVKEDDRMRSNLSSYGSVGNGDIETLHNDRKHRA